MIFPIFIMTAIISKSTMAFPQNINNDDYEGGGILCSSEKEAGYR